MSVTQEKKEPYKLVMYGPNKTYNFRYHSYMMHPGPHGKQITSTDLK